MIIKDTIAEVTALYNTLSDGGKVIEKLAPMFWTSMYGMVEDRFGICWQVMTSE
jgi:PhnB protein